MRLIKYFTYLFIIINIALFVLINHAEIENIVFGNNYSVYNYILLPSMMTCYFFFLIALFVFSLSNRQELEVNLFVYLCFGCGWNVALLIPSEPFIAFSIFVNVVTPVLLFLFFSAFTKQFSSPLFPWLLSSLIGLCIFIVATNLVLKEAIFLWIVSLLLCFLLSTFNKNKLSLLPLNDRRMLLLAAYLSLAPLIVLEIFRHWQSHIDFDVTFFLSNFCYIALLALPLAVTYILIKRNRIPLLFPANTYGREAFAAIILMIIVLCYAKIGLHMPTAHLLLLLIVATTAYFFYINIRQELLFDRYQKLNDHDLLQTHAKQKIIKQMSYNDYSHTLGTVILSLFSAKYPNQGVMLIKKEQNRLHILVQTGSLEKQTLTPVLQNNLSHATHTLTIDQTKYWLIPLQAEKTLVGWIVTDTYPKPTPQFSDLCEQIGVLFFTADDLAVHEQIITPNYIRLYEETQKGLQFVTRSDEIRKNLAYYLHDEVLQNLLALRNIAETASQKTVAENKTLMLIAHQLNTMNTTIREKMFDLYPSSLADLPFSQSVHILVRQLTHEHLQKDLPLISVNIEESLQVPQVLKFTLFRIIKELVNNAIKHASATEIMIDAAVNDPQLTISIIDDGVGIDPQIINDLGEAKGFGLLSISQEIESLSGTFNIYRLTHGTKIILTLPKNIH